MSKEKQIEEMDAVIRDAVNGCSSYWSGLIADALYEEGYRKQSEGEWIEKCVTLSWLEDDFDIYYVCSNCKIETPFTSKFCPDCGAKMKGGAE